MNIICLFIDRFNIRFTGPYGCSLGLTPFLDSLAGESTVFDWYFTNSLDLNCLYRDLWKSPGQPQSLPQILQKANFHTMLLTDEPAVANLPIANDFVEKRFIPEDPSAKYNRAENETQLFKMFSEFGTAVNKLRRNKKPYFLWGHLKAFSGAWNFPQQNGEDNDRNNIRETTDSNDDSSVNMDNLDSINTQSNIDDLDNPDKINYPNASDCLDPSKNSDSQTTDQSNKNSANSNSKTNNSPSENTDLEDLSSIVTGPGSSGSPFFQVTDINLRKGVNAFPTQFKKNQNELYAAGVQHLDDLLGGLLNFFDEKEILDDTLFVLAGSRGIPLGEHRHIGTSDSVPEPLYFESTHLPLLIRFPNGDYETIRVQALCGPSDLFDTLAGAPTRLGEKLNQKNKPNTIGQSGKIIPDLTDLAAETIEELHSHLFIYQKNKNSKQRACVTKNWFLIQNDTDGKSTDPDKNQEEQDNPVNQYELYVFPFDRWNVSEVSDRCEDALEEMSALLKLNGEKNDA